MVRRITAEREHIANHRVVQIPVFDSVRILKHLVNTIARFFEKRGRRQAGRFRTRLETHSRAATVAALESVLEQPP